MRIVFSLFLLLHGLIHLLGFVKAFGFAEIEQLTQPISRTTGLLWLLTGLLNLIAAGMLLVKLDTWWWVALPALLFSQGLIFASFQDAKYGSVANLIILVGVVWGWGTWDFQHMVKQERQVLFAHASEGDKKVIAKASIEDLPPVVQHWLHRSGVVGKPVSRKVHLWQQGEMRTSPDGAWMPFTAEQYFTLNPPAFHWVTDVKGPMGMPIAGRDQYKDGKGQMLIKLLSVIPVVNASGPETDQGTLLRYLAEIIWFPSAALEDYISWEQRDSTSAKATMSYGDVTASGIFRFTPEGDMLSFEAQRYYGRKGGATLETWHIETLPDGYASFEGIRVPARSTVTWKLQEGDYTWLKVYIEDIDY